MQRVEKPNTRLWAAILAAVLFCAVGCFALGGCKKDAAVVGIEIVSPPLKTGYVAGQTFDPSGMVVRAHYSDGRSEAVDDYALNPSTALSIAATRVKVLFGGYEDSVPIVVYKKAAVQIEITAPPAKTSYLCGDVFDPSGMEVTAWFNDATKQVVTDFTFDTTPFASESAFVTIFYGGKTAIQPIHVARGLVIEAEKSVILSRYSVTKQTQCASQTAYVAGLVPDDSLTISFYAPSAAQGTLGLRAASVHVPAGSVDANGNPTKVNPTQFNRVATILVDGQPLDVASSVVLSGSSTPPAETDEDLRTRWSELSFPITAKEGVNTVQLRFLHAGLTDHYGAAVTANVDRFVLNFDSVSVSSVQAPTFEAELDPQYAPKGAGTSVVFWGNRHVQNLAGRYNAYALPQEYDPSPNCNFTYGGVRDFVSLSSRMGRKSSKSGRSIENLGSQNYNSLASGSNTIAFVAYANGGNVDIELELACAFGDAKNPQSAQNFNAPMENLGRFMDVRINGLCVDMSKVSLYPRKEEGGAVDNWDNWTRVYIKGVPLSQGEFILKIVTKPIADYADTTFMSRCPNIGSVMVYPAE